MNGLTLKWRKATWRNIHRTRWNGGHKGRVHDSRAHKRDQRARGVR